MRRAAAELGLIGGVIGAIVDIPSKMLGSLGGFAVGLADHIYEALTSSSAPFVCIHVGIVAERVWWKFHKYWFGSTAWTRWTTY